MYRPEKVGIHVGKVRSVDSSDRPSATGKELEINKLATRCSPHRQRTDIEVFESNGVGATRATSMNGRLCTFRHVDGRLALYLQSHSIRKESGVYSDERRVRVFLKRDSYHVRSKLMATRTTIKLLMIMLAFWGTNFRRRGARILGLEVVEILVDRDRAAIGIGQSGIWIIRVARRFKGGASAIHSSGKLAHGNDMLNRV
ncbi:hypothetical protein V8E55_003431 [Tylopilus felleus]